MSVVSFLVMALAALSLLGGCRKGGERPRGGPETTAGSTTPAGKPEWQRLVDGWEEADPIPSFQLVDQEGGKLRLGDLSDRYVLVGFIFTSCSVPTACPLTTKKMRETQKLWKDRASAGKTKGRRLQLLSFTLDPENDTPPVLKRYGAAYGADFSSWIFATGPAGLMEDGLPSLFGVLAMPSRGTIAHNVKAALLAPGLKSIEEWEDNSFEPARVVRRVLSSGNAAPPPSDD